MLPYGNSKVSRFALGLFFLVLIAYGYFEARGLLFGPRITVTSTVTVSHEQFVRIQGKTDHISSLLMNGKGISVTEDGSFDEPILLAPGSNRIILTAKDKYGNTTSEILDIFYSTEPLTTPETATSSTSTTP